MSDALPVDDKARQWLIENEFDEAFLSPLERKAGGMSSQQRKEAFSSAAATDPYLRYIRERTITIDPKHGLLERRFHKALKGVGATDLKPNIGGIDLMFQHPSEGSCLAELKPARAGETKYAIRFAVGQVLEYRHFIAQDARMLIVLGARPSSAELEYLRTIDVSCAWETQSGRFEFLWQ